MQLRSHRLMLNVLILPILTILLISGCQSTKSLEIFTKEVERIPLAIELPPVELMEEINYLIINEANQEEVFAKLKEANIDPVLFGLTDEDYELMQKNNVRLRNQLIRYRQIIEAYKEYYEPKKDKNSKSEDDKFTPKKFNSND